MARVGSRYLDQVLDIAATHGIRVMLTLNDQVREVADVSAVRMWRAPSTYA